MIRFSSCLAPKGDCMNSEKLLLDLDQGFWTTTDGYKTKVHTSTNYISDDYVRLITDYENRDDEVKDYIDNLIAANPNESYITISINPTTKEIEFAFGIYNANLTNYFKHDYKFQLIKDLSKLLYNVDTIDNSTTNEYKQQIGSNFEKYKEIVDSVIVEGLIDSIGDIIKDDFYTSDEEHDCRYYCEFFGEHLDLYQDTDKNVNYRIGLVFNKKQECVDYFIDRIIDGNVDYDVQKELSPYNKEIFRIAENKIKNLVLQKFHTQELYNISKNIDWSGFTEEMFNKFKNELLTGIEKPDWKGSINVGSVSFEITQYEKTEENPWLDYKVFILGEDNGYEYEGKDNDTIPYAFYEGNQFVINMITENIYEQFKEKFTNLIIDDLKENNIQNSEHVKKEMMRPTIDWNNYETSKKLYLDKIIEKIEWENFSKVDFELLKKEILSGNVKEGFKGKLNCGALSIEFHQHDKEYDFMDFDYYILGEEGEGEIHNVPYWYESGEVIKHQLIKENDYKTFKKDFTNILSKVIEKHHFLKEATKYKTIDWADEIEVKNFYLEKLNGKEFFKTETLSNVNELKFIINSLEPSLDFKKSDAAIVLDYLVGGDYLSFENNTLKYKGDDGKVYGENLFDVLEYIKANIQENIENIAMNIEDDFSHEEDREYLKKLKEQVLPSIQNKCNFLRLKEIFKDKSSDMAFNGLEKANFDELYLDCKNSFSSKTDEELLVEAASRMIMSNVNDFGYFSVQNYDELFDKEDGADYRFSLCESAAKQLIDSKIRDFSQVEKYIKNQSKEVFKNECLKELEKQTFLDDVEKIVDLSIDSLDKDDYLDTYSYLTEEEYDRTKYLFDNFYKTENQTGSIDLKALYDSKESIDNVVTLENGAEIRKVIESDEGEEREYYDLYDKDVCSVCDGENYEVKAVIDGTYYLKGLDSEYEDSGFALSTEEYLIATQRLGLLIENQILDINVWEETYDCGCLNDEIAEKLFDNYKDAEGYNDVIHIFAEKNEDGSFEYHLDRHNPETGECKECLLDRDIPQILKDYLQKEIELFETKNKDLEKINPQFISNLIENNRVFDRYELTIQNDNELLKQMNLNSELLNHTFIFDITSTMGRDKELSRAFIRKELSDGTKAEENIDLDMIPPKLQDKLQDWFKKESHGRELHIIEDVYNKLADKICQAAYEASASGFNYSFDLVEIATLADRDINWVKTHIEKIGEALVEHNDELLLDFNPNENINLEENHIDFNFCSVGEDANELFKCVEGRWQRKTNRELEADGYIIYESKKDGYEAGYSEEYELNDLTQEEQEPQIYKKIHSKASNGVEYWEDYDDKGNLIHCKYSNGYEQWTEYDDKGNVIHCKDSNRDEEWTDYDEKGNEIHYLTSGGYEYWKEYDEKGNECHFKNSDGLEEWMDYDEKGNLIHCKNSDGYEEWMEYDDKGNEIHFKDSKSWEHWKEYDDKGNEIHFKDFRGYEIWKKYNEKGNVIYCKDSNGAEYWKGYDDKGNEIHYKDSKGFERSSTVEYVSKEQYLQEKIEQTEKDGYETFKEPMQIVEEISKEEFNLEKDFRYLLLENMKTTKSPFVATHKIFEELKQKNDTERIKEFNKYLKDNNCTTKKGFEKFFIEIIGLTKKEPNKTQDKEFNESYSLKR